MIYKRDKRLCLKATSEFRNTNKIWNDYGFNQRESIGSTMFLIRQRKPKTFIEWAKYYFDTGEKRLQLLKNKNLSVHDRKNIDYYNGRIGRELADISAQFAKVANISYEMALNYVCIRVLDETWDGYLREQSGYTAIRKECFNYKNLRVVESPNYIDLTYAVDFEIKYNGKPILGIQVKPPTFESSKLEGVADSWSQNIEKHIKYKQTFKADTMFLYINEGKILNREDLINWLNTYILKNKEVITA